jgi:cyclopropane fatty-acyl-phospholipid synthase-like methyltransferase
MAHAWIERIRDIVPGVKWLLPFVIACGSSEHAAEHPAEHHHDHRGGMPHRFENADQWAKVFDDPARDAWQQPDRVIAALELAPAMTVADIGAGTGYFTVRLARAVPQGQVIATDIEPDMIRYMNERAAREQLTNVRAVVTPPADPQLAEASVDRILVVDVWHHLGDRVAYAKALARGLKAGGKLAIVDFKMSSSHGPPPQHRLAPEAIMSDLRAAGLTSAVSPTDLPDQYIVTGTR